jgi:hypothetical protein
MQKNNGNGAVEHIDKDTAKRIDRIKSHHDSILTHQRDANLHRFFCGVELNRQKDALKHGDFGDWCKAHLPFISKGSADRYRALAMTLVSKFPTVGNLTERLEITNGEHLPEKETKAINEALSDALDGKTITAFMRGEGIIRDKKEAGGAKRKLTAEEETEAERDTARRIGEATLEQIEVCKGFGEDEGKTIMEMPLSLRRQILAAATQLNKVLRKHCKGKKAK